VGEDEVAITPPRVLVEPIKLAGDLVGEGDRPRRPLALGAELLADGAAPLPRVPAIAIGGGTAFAGDAIELVCERLEMTNPRRPRLLYVLSDGGWADTQAGVQKIRWLAAHAVPTIHLSIGIAPLSVECDRITVISDPADPLDHVAADTVAALRAGRRRRG
jgi:hypothetical protein